MPNVPIVPGVPALFGAISSASAVVVLTKDILGAFGLIAPRWGIFKDGKPVVTADSVVDMTYKQEWSISDFPVEQGGFSTYDKVNTPFDARVKFASGGSEATRTALLNSIAAIAGDLNLYDVVTPEAVYKNVNVMHYDYHRTATRGVGLLQVEVWLIEVRVTAVAVFNNTQSPAGADPVSIGTVQPGLPTSTQLTNLPLLM